MKSRAVVLAAALILMLSSTTAALAQAATREVRGPIWISVPASAHALQAIQVKAPAAGNLTITVTGTLVYEHTLGTEGSYCLQLSQISGNVGGCVPDAGSDSAIRSYVAADFQPRCLDSAPAPNTPSSAPFLSRPATPIPSI